MASKFLPIHFNNIGKYVAKRFKCTSINIPEGNKQNSDTNSGLPCVLKDENVAVQRLPAPTLDNSKNAIDIPSMMTSFFNEKMQAIFKEPLFASPFKDLEIMSKHPYNTTTQYSDKGMMVSIDMKGFKQEDVNIQVDGPWLVIEAQNSTPVPEEEGGGLRMKHVIRRFEIPPNSDVSNIKVTFKGETLTVTIPSLHPKTISGKPAVLSKRALCKQFASHRYASSSTRETQDIDEQGKSVQKSIVAITDKGMYITMNVKGFREEDIYVTVERTRLKVSVQRTYDIPDKEGGGKRFKQLYRLYHLPENSDLQNISIKMSGDILKISVPLTIPEIKWASKDEGQEGQS